MNKIDKRIADLEAIIEYKKTIAEVEFFTKDGREWNKAEELLEILLDYKRLSKVPNADEVCAAIQDCLYPGEKGRVWYHPVQKQFWDNSFLIVSLGGGSLFFGVPLPLELVELIAKFFKEAT